MNLWLFYLSNKTQNELLHYLSFFLQLTDMLLILVFLFCQFLKIKFPSVFYLKKNGRYYIVFNSVSYLIFFSWIIIFSSFVQDPWFIFNSRFMESVNILLCCRVLVYFMLNWILVTKYKGRDYLCQLTWVFYKSIIW